MAGNRVIALRTRHALATSKAGVDRSPRTLRTTGLATTATATAVIAGRSILRHDSDVTNVVPAEIRLRFL
jgi:hypothetical protein